ncbi:B3/4 domain-containing protein [Bacillus sinesaloumensis]|uniref:B3/B4 domain-containing protein n=1 Tax=Litchfieldia sinesaloumensis TaxID=1926280 RepID=UPI000988607C|nr:phenylalanine--tRNA ligase beta subunit-related protein [Bacillus sinesaloumensis]
MEIHISPHLKELVPNLKVGIIQYEHIEVGESPQMIRGRLQTFQESLFFDLEDKPVTDVEGISAWRQIFKQVGTDPNRYRPSVEAIYRRIQKQNFLSSIHSAVDLNNFFSMQYEIPIGIYDTTKIKGDIEIRIGQSSDEYMAINGRVISMKDKMLSSDETGAFGSPYVDSERTAVTTDTKHAIQIVYLNPSLQEDSCKNLLASLGAMFTQVHGGSAKSFLVM